MSDIYDMEGSLSRRYWLFAACSAASLGFAGCLGSDDGETDDDSSDTSDVDADTPDRNGADDTSNGDDGPIQEGEPVLSGLRIADTQDSAELDAGDDEPVTVTVTNDGEAGDEFDIHLSIVAVEQTQESGLSESKSVTIDAGHSETVTFDGVTDALGGGTHDVRVTAGDDELTEELVVFGRTELTIHVYSQEASFEYRANAGDLVVRNGETQVATADLSEAYNPTVEIPFDESSPYTVEVSNLDDGAYPGDSREVTVDDPDAVEIEFVVAYKFRGAESFNFTGYTFEEEEVERRGGTVYVDPAREFVDKGTLAANGDMYSTYISGPPDQNKYDFKEIDESPFPFETDFESLAEERNLAPPRQYIEVDGEWFYNPFNEDSWEETDFFAFNPVEINRHATTLFSVDGITNGDPKKQQFTGREELRDKTVDVYDAVVAIGERELPNARVFINPKTGYVVRFEAERVYFEGEPFDDSHHMVEFMNHNEIDELDLADHNFTE